MSLTMLTVIHVWRRKTLDLFQKGDSCDLTMQAVVSCPNSVPLSSLCTPQPLAVRAAPRDEKSLTWCKHCSATTKTSVCFQHDSHPRSKAHHHVSYWEGNPSCILDSDSDLQRCRPLKSQRKWICWLCINHPFGRSTKSDVLRGG